MFATKYREFLLTVPGLWEELDEHYQRLNTFLLKAHDNTGALLVDPGGDGLAIPVVIASGGTGAITAPAARASLGVAIGSNVQAWDAELDTIAQAALITGSGLGLTRTLFVETADKTIANTTTETTMFGTGVGSLTLPANFWIVGRTLRIEIHGDFADTGNPTAEVQAYLGSTSCIDSGAITLAGLAGTEEWECVVLMTCRSTGASGTIETVIDWEYETSTGSSAIERLNVAGTTTTIDTTGTLVIDATFQWGTAAAANTLTSTIGCAQVLS